MSYIARVLEVCGWRTFRVQKLVSDTESRVQAKSLNAVLETRLEKKVDDLHSVVTSQQKVIEMNQRTNRWNNIIIVGVEEQQGEDTMEVVRTLPFSYWR